MRIDKQLVIIPITVFIIEWIFIFFLSTQEYYSSRFIRFETYFILTCGIVFVVSGYVFPFLFRSKNEQEYSTSFFDKVDFIKLNRLNIALILLSLVGAFLAIIEIGKMANDPLIFFKNPLLVRIIVTSVGEDVAYAPTILYKLGSYLLNLGLITTFVSSILMTSEKFFWSTIMPIIIGILISFIYFSRYLFITFILFYIITIFIVLRINRYTHYYNFIKRRFSLTLISSISLIIIIFALILFARNFYRDKLVELAYQQFYFYLTGGISCFDAYLFQIHSEFTNGTSILRGLNKWLIIFGLAPDNIVVGADHDFVKINSFINLNTYTFAKSMYQDFGLSGVVFLSTVWGFISSKMIIKTNSNFSLIKLYISTVLIFSLIMSFFGFYLESVSVILFRAVLVFITGLAITSFCLTNK